jgi:hypothetical protein
MSAKSTLSGLIVLLSLLWCLLLAATTWVYMVLSGRAPAPQVSGAAGEGIAVAASAAERLAIEVPLNATSFFKIVASLQWWAVGVGVTMALGFGLASLVHDKVQEADD